MDTSYDKYLCLVDEEVYSDNIDKETFFKYIIETTNFSDLCLFEARSLLNSFTTFIFHEDLKDFGVSIYHDYDENNNPVILYSYADLTYRQVEKDGVIYTNLIDDGHYVKKY